MPIRMRAVDRWSRGPSLVAHDGMFRVLVLTLFGLPLERFWSFPFNLCAITVVALQDGVPVLTGAQPVGASCADRRRGTCRGRGARRSARRALAERR